GSGPSPDQSKRPRTSRRVGPWRHLPVTGPPPGSTARRHAREQSLQVADALGRAGDGVLAVLLVFQADQVPIPDVEQRLEHGLQVEDTASQLDWPALRVGTVDVLQVQVIQARGALADRLGGVDPAPRRVADVDAQADALVITLDRLPGVVG